jgi:hypothetical protein
VFLDERFSAHGVILTLDVGEFYTSQREQGKLEGIEGIDLPETTPSKVDMEAVGVAAGPVGVVVSWFCWCERNPLFVLALQLTTQSTLPRWGCDTVFQQSYTSLFPVLSFNPLSNSSNSMPS